MKLFNAYYDDREIKPVIRVLVAVKLLDHNEDIHCQFWDKSSTLLYVVKASNHLMIWNEKSFGSVARLMFAPYLINCFVQDDSIPAYVSLSSKPDARASKMLNVINNKPADGVRKNFIVSVKQLVFKDQSFVIRFIEWIEMMKIFGADKIDVFYREVHPNYIKVMEYYRVQGVMDYRKYSPPASIQSISHNRLMNVLQMIQHTDCFYRTRNLYKYLVVLDTDEVIVPMRTEDRTWMDLVEKRYNMSSGAVSFLSWNAIFSTNAYNEENKNFYMLNHFNVRLKIQLIKKINLINIILAIKTTEYKNQSDNSHERRRLCLYSLR